MYIINWSSHKLVDREGRRQRTVLAVPLCLEESLWLQGPEGTLHFPLRFMCFRITRETESRRSHTLIQKTIP